MSSKEFKELYESSPKIQRLVDIAIKLEGMPRNISTHAAGVVITDKEITEYVPVATSSDVVVTQYDMDTISQLGLLKFDFLALRYLTIIDDTCADIREKHTNFNIDSIPLNDEATFKLISKGNTLGVFQLESNGIRQMLTNLRPENLDDLIAAISLYRPGPMDSIPRYIEARHSPESVTYDIPQLEPILKSTYGCMVYQEQVLRILRELGGFTYGHADLVRRAMSKKKAEIIEAERENFLNGTDARGIDRVLAEELFEDIAAFANYAYNKSHAAAYAIISYRTAYLKTHYTQEYYAALMTSVLGSLPKLGEYIEETRKLNIKVLPPNINESTTYFHADGNGNILYGLLAIKNTGKQAIEAIIRERRNGQFKSFEDFISRMLPSGLINKRLVESLIKAGAFDSLGKYRSQLIASFEKIIELESNKHRSVSDGQIDMFTNFIVRNDADISSFEYPKIEEYSIREKLLLEKEAAGMYLSAHMIDNYDRHLSELEFLRISDILTAEQDEALRHEKAPSVKIAGVITSVSIKTSRKNEKFAFFSIADRTSEIECIVFPTQFSKYSGLIHNEMALYIEGTVSRRDDEDPKIVVNSLYQLVDNDKYQKSSPVESKKPTAAFSTNENVSGKVQPTVVYLRVPSMSCEVFRKLDNLAEIFIGRVELCYYDAERKVYNRKNTGIDLCKTLLAEFISLLGEDNVVVK